jgi:hypothetical protein
MEQQELSKRIVLKYLLFCVLVLLLRTVFSRIYLRRNIPVIRGNKLSPTANKIYISYFLCTMKRYCKEGMKREPGFSYCASYHQ